MPPSKLIVTIKLFPKGGFLIRGVLIKGGTLCVYIYIYVCIYIYIYIYMSVAILAQGQPYRPK